MGRHAANTPVLPPQPVIVIGSYRWALPEVVEDVLEDIANKHENLAIITSGCPEGAERIAREWANSMTLPHLEMRDEEILSSIQNAIVVAFIRDESEGATTVLNGLRSKFWTRVIRDDTSTPPAASAWARR